MSQTTSNQHDPGMLDEYDFSKGVQGKYAERYYAPMPKLNLKPNHKAIRDYYATLQQYQQHHITHEGAVSSPVDTLLQACAKQVNATLVPQYSMHTRKGNRIVIDGAILDEYGLPLAYWEAKDIDDNLSKSVQQKQDAGYPLDNTLFQTPQRAILYQNGQVALDIDITSVSSIKLGSGQPQQDLVVIVGITTNI